MGKNNTNKGKLNPVFRVAGGKAAKSKTKFKAQPVSTKLKQLSSNNQKKKIELLDNTLTEVQKKITSDLSSTVSKKKETIKNDTNNLSPADVDAAVLDMSNL